MRRFVQAIAADAVPADLSSGIAAALSDAPPRYNIASHGDALVLVMHDGEVAVDTLRWGLVPRWSKLPETAYSTITARLDRASTSRIYARPWASRRCVVPMNGYYKWDRSGARPVPHFIQSRNGDLLFAAAAGLVRPADHAEQRDSVAAVARRPAVSAGIEAPRLAVRSSARSHADRRHSAARIRGLSRLEADPQPRCRRLHPARTRDAG